MTSASSSPLPDDRPHTGSATSSEVQGHGAGETTPTGRGGLAGTLLGYILTFTGYFAMLPVLAVLVRDLGGLNAVQVGAVLVVFTVAARAGSLLLAPALHRLRQWHLLMGAPALTALSLGVLALRPPFPAMLVCLAAAGLGISVNGLAVRVFLAASRPSEALRMKAFALLNVCLNVAATVGPMLGTTLYRPSEPALLFACDAAVFLMSALAALAVVVRRPVGWDNRVDDGRRFSPREYLRVIRSSKHLRWLLAVTILGWILYAQLFSALPLFLFRTVPHRSLIGTVYALGAILIVLCQLPVATFIGKRLTPTVGNRVLLAGVALFPLSFLIIGGTGGGLVALYLAIVVFTGGEILFTPLVDTALAGYGSRSGFVAVFAGKQVALALGESTGAFIGGTGFLFVSAATGSNLVYWFITAVVALACLTVLALLVPRSAPGGGTPPE